MLNAMMDDELRTRLLVVGEMAEKFFPPGFCAEVVGLTELLPDHEATNVLHAYNYFLQTQYKYQQVAGQVYEDLLTHLAGRGFQDRWRLDFLVENARTPYEEEYVDPLRRAVQNCTLKPVPLQTAEDLEELMSAVATLSFIMGDSPSYPSERPLQFYQLLYSGKKTPSLGLQPFLSRALVHAKDLLAQHVQLLSTLPASRR